MTLSKAIRAVAAALGLGGLLAACDVAYPVTVIGGDGMTFRGSATNTFLEGGTFQASNGRAVCTGTYRQHSDIRTVSFPVVCNTGLTGIGTAKFDTARSGSGFVTMSDGSQWQFIFGRDALRI